MQGPLFIRATFIIAFLGLATGCAQLPMNTLAEAETETTAATASTATAPPPSAPPLAAALAANPAPLAAPVSIPDEPGALRTIDLTTPPDDLWQQVRNGFGMRDLDSPLVAKHQAWYLNHPAVLQAILARSRRYLFHIVDELAKRGMPSEIALLPVIESAFNPQAHSPARALGIWQFIPATGRNFKLEKNWWLDERRDIVASTRAALDYLQQIYEMHGDWHLALASYNWGENAVARAIAKNRARGRPIDYSDLVMPAETRNYLPKLQAVKNIIDHPEVFGFYLAPIPNKPYFSLVEVGETVDLATAARLAETPLDEFIALNPAYQRPVIPNDARSPLAIPVDKASIFVSNLLRETTYAQPLSAWRTHTLQARETLPRVAALYGISLARLKQLNGITARSKAHIGQTLLVPARRDVVASAELLALLPKDVSAAKPPRGKARGKRKKSR